MSAAAPMTTGVRVPELRQDLRLFEGPHGAGEHSWLVYDPVRHRYFQVSRRAFDLLQCWAAEPAAELARRAGHEFDRDISEAEVAELAKFVIANNLALLPPQDDARALAAQQTRTRQSWMLRAVHGYLFFKVPLARPERFLRATMPMVEPLFTRAAAVVIAVLSLLGLYLVSRQWDLFVATFMDFLSLEGALVYVLALVVIKALHELGHAYAATRLGVRVNTMGVAFMVMTPILYTDVTDAWRLRHHRDKLAIDAAGIVVELALSGIAFFLWAFLPDGPARAAAFVTATTSLITGLAVNLNPLMRFDGYYLLADAWHMPNLQARCNEMGRWRLREALFGLGLPPPEPMTPRRRRLMIVYAFAVWVYRFFLFVGIALVVYYMFFKTLGILLFAVEIIWFICLPIFHEVRTWWDMRNEIAKSRRSIVTMTIAAVVLALFMAPWSGTVSLQGVTQADLETTIYAPRPGRLQAVEVVDEKPVLAGDILVVLRSSELDHEVGQTQRQMKLILHRLARIAGDEADRSERVVLESELARHATNLAGLEVERRRLIVRSPHAGVVRDVDVDLRAGEWIDEATPVARIVTRSGSRTQGYVKEDDVWRVAPGGKAIFVPEDPMLPSRHGHIVEIVETGIRTVDVAYLASVYGGSVASDKSVENEIRPRSGFHLVQVQLDGAPVDRAVRGTLHLAAKRESLASAVWRRVLRVLVRESSA